MSMEQVVEQVVQVDCEGLAEFVGIPSSSQSLAGLPLKPRCNVEGAQTVCQAGNLVEIDILEAATFGRETHLCACSMCQVIPGCLLPIQLYLCFYWHWVGKVWKEVQSHPGKTWQTGSLHTVTPTVPREVTL